MADEKVKDEAAEEQKEEPVVEEPKVEESTPEKEPVEEPKVDEPKTKKPEKEPKEETKPKSKKKPEPEDTSKGKEPSEKPAVEEKPAEADKKLLIPEEAYLTSGVHIGTQQKSADMKPFLFKVRNDGLYVLDVKKTDERIKTSAQMLARYDPSEILVVSARQYGKKPAKTFAKTIGAQVLAGRFIPGTLTNYNLRDFIEPNIIFVTDPAADQQAIREAIKVGIPIIGLCDANNETKNVDMVIPSNNKGRRSLALVYWLLTREVLKGQGKIAVDDDFKLTVDDFEATL